MELWTSAHAKTLLPAVAVMIVIAVVLRLTIGKKELKIRIIPFQMLALILFALEIGKQVCSLIQGYDLYHLPFHFCSLFIFVLPLMAFYRGRHWQTLFGIVSALCAAVTLLMMIYPSLIYSAGNVEEFFRDYFSFHTVAFHNIVVFEFILIVALGLHEPQKKGEPKAVALFMVGFCAVSAIMAQLLKTNFNNFYTCNVPPLESLRVMVLDILGTVPTAILYVLIVTVLDILFVLMSYWLYRLCRKLAWNQQKSAVGG